MIEEVVAGASRSSPAKFHSECVRAAAAHFGVTFEKVSGTRYKTANDQIRLVCAVSALHRENGGGPYFWFSVHQSQIDFLRQAPSSWFCFGCGSAKNTLLIPASDVEELLPNLSGSAEEGRRYWHVVVQNRDGAFSLRLPGAIDGPNLGQHLARLAAHLVTTN